MNAEIATRNRSSVAAPPQAGLASDWTIDTAYTLVQFAVKHLGFTTAHGRFPDIWGTIHCGDEIEPASASVEATIAAASIATGDIRLDAYLRSADFLNVRRYPRITFTSTRVERVAKDRLQVTGDLTIRDVTREVVLEATHTGRGNNPRGQAVVGFTARTRFRMNRKVYGLSSNSALESGCLFLGDQLDVRIEVQAIKRTTPAGSLRARHLTLLEIPVATNG